MIYDLRFTRLRQATARQAIYMLASSFVICHSSFGQGVLTPPGAPAPTMLTLSQIEPRTPVDAAHTPGNGSSQFVITNPGSYYLTANVVAGGGVHGITIATNNVTLDLNGFTIASASGSGGSGIWITGNSDISIYNGHIKGGVTNNGSGTYTGPGFFYGIYYNGPQNVLVRGVTVSGVLYYGIFLSTGNSTAVEGCEVHTAGTYGIYASSVKSSSALDIGSTALLGNEVSDCYGQSTAGDAIVATVAQNSYGYSFNNTYGIYADSTLNCYGYNNGSGTGIQIVSNAKNCYGYNTGVGYGIGSGSVGTGGTTVESCQGYSNSGIGIMANTAQNCYGSTSSGTAVSAQVALNCQGYAVGGSGYAIYAVTAENCYGDNNGSGYGIYAVATALNCDGLSSTGTGLYALIVDGSHGNSISTFHNVNSF